MRLTLSIELPADDGYSDSVSTLLQALGSTITDLIGGVATYDESDSVSLMHEMAGTVEVWAIYVGRRMVWNHTSVNGSPPDAIAVWQALAEYLPMREEVDA